MPITTPNFTFLGLLEPDIPGGRGKYAPPPYSKGKTGNQLEGVNIMFCNYFPDPALSQIAALK